MIYILLAAGLVSVLIGEAEDAFSILYCCAAKCRDWSDSGIQSGKERPRAPGGSEDRIESSEGRKDSTVDSSELVPGDVVLLESREKVSADLRLTSTNNLTVDESFLTGESTTVEKTDKEIDEELEIGDRNNLAFAGSMVITGRGKAVVVATG